MTTICALLEFAAVYAVSIAVGLLLGWFGFGGETP